MNMSRAQAFALFGVLAIAAVMLFLFLRKPQVGPLPQRHTENRQSDKGSETVARVGETIRVEVRADVEGSAVYLDGSLVGRTPIVLERPKDEKDHQLRIEGASGQAVLQTVRLDRAQAIEVALPMSGLRANIGAAVRGKVIFDGPAPARRFLDRRADSFCARTEAQSEEIIVGDDGILQNVIVRVKGVLGRFEPPSTPHVIDQVDCNYRPRVSAALAGQTIHIRNSDATMHNVHTFRGDTTLFNEAMPPIANLNEKKKTLPPGEPSIVKWKCDVHPWMSAYLLVSSHPFFDVTGEAGTFAIEGIPPGRYVLEAWHEKLGTKQKDVVLSDGERVTLDFAYRASDGP